MHFFPSEMYLAQSKMYLLPSKMYLPELPTLIPYCLSQVRSNYCRVLSYYTSSMKILHIYYTKACGCEVGIPILFFARNVQGASKKTFFSENLAWQILMLIMRNIPSFFLTNAGDSFYSPWYPSSCRTPSQERINEAG